MDSEHFCLGNTIAAMRINRHLRRIVLIAALLDFSSNVKAIPPECDPDYILLQDEESCFKDLLKINISQADSQQPECRGFWDHLNCWPHADVGETVSQPCPRFLHNTGRVYRNCTEHGWTEPFPPHEIACEYAFETLTFPFEAPTSHGYFLYVQVMYSVGYAISTASLTIATATLCLFRRLHCTRNYVHIQLFLSFILRATFIFIRDAVLFSSDDHFHCDSYPVSCKIATTFSNYCIMANYSWLLAEGHYLYSLVSVSLFSQKRHLRWYIVLGWGSPMVIIVAWSLAKYTQENEGCWERRGHEGIWWILRVPVLLFIVVNLLFFLSIIRILVAKLRTQEMHRNELNQYRRLAKSTLLLVSLFGLHYVLFAFLPHKVSEIWNFIELAFASTQGFVVAVLYCFLNGEVQYEVQRRWRRWRLKQHLPGEARRQHGSMSQSVGAHTQVSFLTRGPSTRHSSLV
ncbi:secretin receptor isoform X1 [Salmo trutta]|uniref:Secretin receptor n=2 Tax=Salmo trutta TaxID=8032 RepID=A0A674D1D7_SALTR|nr:secretin receptor isoform X1 [Salmo trutta]